MYWIWEWSQIIKNLNIRQCEKIGSKGRVYNVKILLDCRRVKKVVVRYTSRKPIKWNFQTSDWALIRAIIIVEFVMLKIGLFKINIVDL